MRWASPLQPQPAQSSRGDGGAARATRTDDAYAAEVPADVEAAAEGLTPPERESGAT